MNSDQPILYEGIHLGEPAQLDCSVCGATFYGRWWWTPDDCHFIACIDCVDNFEVRDEWPDMERYGKEEQLRLWESES